MNYGIQLYLAIKKWLNIVKFGYLEAHAIIFLDIVVVLENFRYIGYYHQSHAPYLLTFISIVVYFRVLYFEFLIMDIFFNKTTNQFL